LYPKLIILSKIDRKSVSASYLISYSPFVLRKLMISLITLIDGLIVGNHWNNQLVLLHTVELLMCKIATLTSRWIAIESRDPSTVRTPPHPDLSRILFSFLSLPFFFVFLLSSLLRILRKIRKERWKSHADSVIDSSLLIFECLDIKHSIFSRVSLQ